MDRPGDDDLPLANTQETANLSAEEEAAQAQYLREGGTLELFGQDAPTNIEFGIMWSLLKRRTMADAMRRSSKDGPLIQVRRVPIEGRPVHFHPGEGEHANPHFSTAYDRLGPLGYSLLRGQLSIRDHLLLRLQLLQDAYEDLVAGVIGARAEGVEHADELFRERARLVFWDGLGLLHQVSERVATLFDALQLRGGTGQDLGELMIREGIQPWKIFHSAAFGSRKTWRRIMGMPAPAAAKAALSAEQQRLLTNLQERSLDLSMVDIAELRRIWTRDLHRVSTTYKHSYPILSAVHGGVWLGSDEATRADVRRLVDAGALVVVDTTADGRPEELVVPVTVGGIEVLFVAVLVALMIASVLASATMQAAEHPSGRVLVVHPSLYQTGEAPVEAVLSLTSDYTGSSDPTPLFSAFAEQATTKRKIEDAARDLRGRVPSGYWHPSASEPPSDTETPGPGIDHR